MNVILSLKGAVGMTIQIRQMRPEDKDQVIALSKNLNKFVKDFSAIWTRWEMWEKNIPFVAADGDKIVGFHGAVFLKKDYVYTMYIGVDPEYAGRGLAKDMTWAAIKHGQTLGLTRFTAKADTRGGGYKFYTGLGMKPVARSKQEYVFDCEFGSSASIEEFQAKLSSGVANTPPSSRKQKLYKKSCEECYFEESNLSGI